MPGSSDVPGDHRTRADHHVIADLTGRIVALEPIATRDPTRVGLPQLAPPARRPADRVRIVDEHHTVCHHAVRADLHQLADEGMRLDSGACTDRDTLLDLHERADEHIVTELAVVDVGGLDDGDIGASNDVHYADVPEGYRAHCRTPRRQRLGRNLSRTSLPVSMDS